MTFHRPLALTALLLGTPALAVGPADSPPTPTETTVTCPEGSVWDADRAGCVVLQDANLAPDVLIDTARELAYAARYDDAISLLAMAPDQGDTMVLTYLGFSHRSAGRIDDGMAFYEQALAVNPDNFLARSYMGMGFVQAGQPELARFELAQIRQRGGAGTWPEQALANAIATGETINY